MFCTLLGVFVGRREKTSCFLLSFFFYFIFLNHFPFVYLDARVWPLRPTQIWGFYYEETRNLRLIEFLSRDGKEEKQTHGVITRIDGSTTTTTPFFVGPPLFFLLLIIYLSLRLLAFFFCSFLSLFKSLCPFFLTPMKVELTKAK